MKYFRRNSENIFGGEGGQIIQHYVSTWKKYNKLNDSTGEQWFQQTKSN